MNEINLESLDGIPKYFIQKLEKNISLFKEEESLEKLIEQEEIKNLIEEIHNYCNQNIIIGFHYTRAFPEQIIEKGLICRTGEEIRADFIKNYSSLFSTTEIQEIKSQWDKYFNKNTKKSRDNTLFFNFTTTALVNHGAQPLLANFGGEQVYMPICHLENISSKIRNIGKPLILKCKLNPLKIKTFYENPWGRIAVSSYHRLQNPEVFQDDQNGYQFENVLPKDIDIIEYKDKL